MNNLLKQLQKEHILSKTDLILLLNDNGLNSELFKIADKTRYEYVGNDIHLRALIEFSNICKQHCFYCGLRCENQSIDRYRISAEEIINSAKKAKKLNFKTIVLQSGEDSFFDTDKMIYIIKAIKKLDFAITLSIGEKTYEEYEAYKKAGADRYLLRIETTDRELYKTMHPKMDFDNRIRCLQDLKELKYEVGSGFLVGLPNQTIDSLADDLLFLKEIDVDMAGIGPFIPCPNTPLAEANIQNNFILSIKTMAIMRLLLPNINIPATTAMETLEANGQIFALQSGANVIMPNITEDNFSSKYNIYPNKANTNQISETSLSKLADKFKLIGRTIGTTKGISKNYKN